MTDKPTGPGSSTSPPQATLDVRGLNCPLPVLKARKALSRMPPGGRLTLLATDPRAPDDLEELCRVAGHRLIERSEEGGAYRFVIERG